MENYQLNQAKAPVPTPIPTCLNQREAFFERVASASIVVIADVDVV